jgi:uncharacterized protein YdhG (YjbR/CyaY superfamily)
MEGITNRVNSLYFLATKNKSKVDPVESALQQVDGSGDEIVYDWAKESGGLIKVEGFEVRPTV